MAEFIITCDVPFTIDNEGDLSCAGIASQYEKPQTIADLSQAEIGSLSGAVLLLFAAVYAIKMIKNVMIPPGRN